MPGWTPTGWWWMPTKLSCVLELGSSERATAAGRQSQLLRVRLEPRRHHRQPVKHIDHVKSLCQACFFQLRQFRQVRWSLTAETTTSAASRLDYCNSLLYGISDDLPKKLSCLEPSSSLAADTRKFDHSRPVLRELHWLPIRKRIVYKLAVMIYKCTGMHGLAPRDLAVGCVPVTSLVSRRQFRSAESGCLVVTGVRTALGTRNFAVAKDKICNSLSADLWLHLTSLQTFGHRLKRYLFECHERVDHPNHLLAPLLPNEAYTPYQLRPRRHNRQLIPKISKLYDSDFIQRMLYKDLYWLIDWQLIDNSLLWFMYSIVFYITSLVLSCVLSTHNKRILYYICFWGLFDSRYIKMNFIIVTIIIKRLKRL